MLDQRIEPELAPIPPLDYVQESGIKSFFEPRTHQEVVVVKSVWRSHESKCVPQARQRGKPANRAIGSEERKPGHQPFAAKVLPPDLLPLGRKEEAGHGRLPQNGIPFSPVITEGSQRLCVMCQLLRIKFSNVFLSSLLADFPRTAVVSIFVPGLLMPRIDMQRCSASNSTITI